MSGIDCATPDAALMRRVSADDECAFEQLYHRYHRRLLDFFYALGRDPQTAEELAADTFARIWHLRKRYAATGSFPAYLFSFARHIWLEHCRRASKQWRLGTAADWADVENSLVALDVFRPDAAAAGAELEQRILTALDALPEEQRMVFVMRVVQRLSLEDIAAVMQCPVNTVRSRKLLALKRLREELQELLAICGRGDLNVQCARIRPMLINYAIDDARVTERMCVDVRIRHCADCREELEELCAVVETADRVLSHPRPTDSFPALMARIHAEERRVRETPLQVRSRRRVYAIRAAVAAAVLVVAAVGSPWWRETGRVVRELRDATVEMESGAVDVSRAPALVRPIVDRVNDMNDAALGLSSPQPSAPDGVRETGPGVR